MSGVLERRQESGELYLEFLNCSTMSVGVYALAAGSTDPQQPHTEDEIYYVLDGRGRICVGDDDLDVKPGSVIFVAAGQDHKFHSITEDLRLLVVFAPARGTRAK
ncbi:MAG: cupin domain-containing protein [Dehalococcoidia bacterium]|nr:cupin domain-containing protein [Dehalococcoidia bacterium]